MNTPQASVTRAEASRQDRPALDLVKTVIDANRSASRQKIKDLFYAKSVERGDVMVRDVHDELVDYYLSYAQREPAPPPRTAADREVERQQVDEAANAQRSAARQAIAKTITLNYKMPNGKKLGDCTFGEIAIIGGFFFRLAQKGKPDQAVRDVLSVAQVKELITG